MHSIRIVHNLSIVRTPLPKRREITRVEIFQPDTERYAFDEGMLFCPYVFFFGDFIQEQMSCSERQAQTDYQNDVQKPVSSNQQHVQNKLTTKKMRLYDRDFLSALTEQGLGERVVRAKKHKIQETIQFETGCNFVFNKKGQESKKRDADVKKTQAEDRMDNYIQQLPETQMTWLEACLQFLRQAHLIISQLFAVKNLNFIRLSYNFEIESGVLTTKQQKKSRIGHSLSLVLELCQVLRMVADVFVRQPTIAFNSIETSNNQLFNIFSQINWKSGIYRYKYQISKELSKIKYLLWTSQKAKGEIGQFLRSSFISYNQIFFFILRGLNPILKTYINNLLSRMLNVKIQSKNTKTITKQRVESYVDENEKEQLIIQCLQIQQAEDTAINRRNIQLHIKEAYCQYKSQRTEYCTNLQPKCLELINQFTMRKYNLLHDNSLSIRQYIYFGTKRINKQEIRGNFEKIQRLFIQSLIDLNQDYADKFAKDETYQDWLRQLFQTSKQIQIQYQMNKITLNSVDFSQIELFKQIQQQLQYQSENQNLSTYNRYQYQHLLYEIQQQPKQFLTNLLQNIDKTTNYITISMFDKFYNIDVLLEESPQDYILEYLISLFIPKFQQVWNSQFQFAGIEAQQLQSYIINYCQNKEDSCIVTIDERPQFMLTSDHVMNFPLLMLQKILLLFMDEQLVHYIVQRLQCKHTFKDMIFQFSCSILQKNQLFSSIFNFLMYIEECRKFGVEACANNGLFLKAVQNNKEVHYKRIGLHCHTIFQSNVNKQAQIPESISEGIDQLNKRIKRCIKSATILDYFDLRLYSYISNIQACVLNIKASASYQSVLQSIGLLISTPQSCRAIVTTYDKQTNLQLFSTFNGFTISNTQICASNASVFALFQSLIHLIICGTLQFLKFANKQNQIIINYFQNFREFYSPNFCSNTLQNFVPLTLQKASAFSEINLQNGWFGNALVHYQKKLQKFVQNQINSNDQSRYVQAMFLLCEQFGGLGMYNYSDPTIPKIQDYIMKWGEILDDVGLTGQIRVNKNNVQQLRLVQMASPEPFLTIQNQYCFPVYKDGEYYVSTNAGITKKISSYTKLQAYYTNILISFSSPQSNPLKFTLFNALSQRSQQKVDIDFISDMSNAVQLFETESQFKHTKLTKAQMHGLGQIPNKRFISFWSPLLNRSEIFRGKEWKVKQTNIIVKGKLNTIKQFYVNLFSNELWSKVHRGVVLDIKLLLNGNMEQIGANQVNVLENHADKAFGEYQYKVAGRKYICDIEICGNIVKYDQFLVSNCQNVEKILNSNESVQQTCSQFYVDVKIVWLNVDQYDENSFKQYVKMDYENDYGSESIDLIRIYVDTVYQRQAILGRSSNITNLLVQKMPNLIQQCKPILLLKQKLSNLLQIFTEQQKTQIITDSNINIVLNNTSLFFFLHDTFTPTQFIKQLYIFNIQKMYVKTINLELNRSQKNKSQQFQEMIYNIIFKEIEQIKPKIVFSNLKMLEQILNKVVQGCNLNSSVFQSSFDFSFEQYIQILSRNNFEANKEIYLFDCFSYENFFRFILMLKVMEQIGYDKFVNLIADLDFKTINCPLLKLISNKKNGHKNINEIDNKLKQILISSFCEKYTFIEQHLINQQQIKSLILGVNINVDDFIKVQQKQFQLEKESKIDVIASSKRHFNQLLDSKQVIRISPNFSEVQLQQFDQLDFDKIQAEVDLQQNNITQSSINTILEQNQLLRSAVRKPIIFPKSISYLRHIAKPNQIFYLYGVEQDECQEVWQVSLTIQDNLEFKILGIFVIEGKDQNNSISETIQGKQFGIIAYSNVDISVIKSDLDIVMSGKCGLEVIQWWE